MRTSSFIVYPFHLTRGSEDNMGGKETLLFWIERAVIEAFLFLLNKHRERRL